MQFLTSTIRHLTSGVAIVAVFASSVAEAQYLTRPQIPWRTINTARFDIHFPAEMEEWTRLVAQRMETVADAVNAVVGNAPTSRVTVIVEDPSNVANGFALPFLEGPIVFLWPTPPSPSPTFGTHRGWGEALAVHEYAHIAHMTFPSRNPRDRLLWKFLPTQLSPLARKSPSWVIEGYATLIEGQLTGSGRPFSSGRAAVLRQWALEGRFPTYGQLNAAGSFLGGSMRYLVGSAYLEWLQQRKGDSSLVHTWRRMSARQERSFDESFAGVFGASPAEMYGAFTVDVTERALQVRNRLREAGLVEGTLVQRLSGATGEPAVSPDGKHVAIVVRSPNGPSRLVVWETHPPPDTAIRRARARLMERDSLDVPAFDSFPRPRRAIATLHPASGRSHEQPRWMPDGIRILVTRDEPAPNGVTRPDLFIWNSRNGEVTRVTRGASIRQADPAPNGREAVAVRCHAGICSLVIVTLESGAWRVLVAGSPELVWNRPRYSADGSRIVASYQAGGKWGVALIDIVNSFPTTLEGRPLHSAAVRRLDDGTSVSRYAPSFMRGDREILVVSDRGGIPNLEVLPVDGGAPRSLTRVTGAALGPDVSRADGSLWFLTMRSGGYDVRTMPAPDESSAGEVVAIDGALAPVAPPTRAIAGLNLRADTVPVIVHDYGLGPRRWRVLPGASFGPDGISGVLMAGNIDPIGRLSIVGQAGIGTTGTWRGASIQAALRRLSVDLDGSAWYVEHEPSRSRDHFAPAATDIRYAGSGVRAGIAGEESNYAYILRAAAGAGIVNNDFLSDAGRFSLSADARARYSASRSSITGRLFAEAGETDGEGWQRTIGSAAIAFGTSRRYARGEWLLGSVSGITSTGSGRAVEQFVVGGSSNPFIDPAFLAQRVPLPAVPAGLVSGRLVQMFRGVLGDRGWEPYFTWVAAGDSLTAYKRIAGIERTFAIEPLAFVRLPGVRARGGASWSFDEPFKNRPRVYASLAYTP